MKSNYIQHILNSRRSLADGSDFSITMRKKEEEGGCGVVGFCCSEPVRGKHIYEPSKQMHNRGNGKGGGIAAVGFLPEELGVSREVLDEYFMLHIAYLDPKVREDLEKKYIYPYFEVKSSSKLDNVDDWKSVPGLEVRPPDVWRYFVRVKSDVLDSFSKKNGLDKLERQDVEDEFIFQNSFKLNNEYYASLGEQKAFVLSHGKDLMILKVVGFAEAIVKYYKIEDLRAHVWIAHQRFPTKGRVWHPGGAHPFAGINMALVHNGDFANYHSVSEYLKQRNIYPQFLTDTEVSALLFDLLDRTYGYPLEYIIEALAPTTELDFDRLPADKQEIYRAIQASHIHGSPDGPWFFIIARNIPQKKQLQLMGITDTAMLRPQVFAFHDGEVQVGIIGSEKQAIDATFHSLSKDDKRICPIADSYWNARGGSHTDGGSFIFNLEKNSNGKIRLTCTDKFGKMVPVPGGQAYDFTNDKSGSYKLQDGIQKSLKENFELGADHLFDYIQKNIPDWSYDDIKAVCELMAGKAVGTDGTVTAIKTFTMLNDRRYSTGNKKRSHILHILRSELHKLFDNIPLLNANVSAKNAFRLIDWDTRKDLRTPVQDEETLVINAAGFQPEGNDCDATLLLDAYMKGWKRFISYGCTGQRYIGCGLGPDTDDVTIDVYDSSGDYLASGIDGLTINVHNNAQDQLAQIIKRGKLVVHGDVGQTFMYGAKGGEVYIMGNAAGRPLINSVGKPKVVINGTCLDFLGESFMAGDPLNGGGFVILNGIKFTDKGEFAELNEPYPGSNIFSLASGGAIYVRDPYKKIIDQQLNGGVLKTLRKKEWELMLPYLEENERLFNIKIKDLLTVNGEVKDPRNVYRKVVPHVTGALGSKTYEDDAEEVIEEEIIYKAG
ncbi:MAG: glutamate synthase [Spirochaetota bacterium]